MPVPYFEAFEDRRPPQMGPLSARRRLLWHFLAGAVIAAGLWYLHWRWSASLNPDALVFSVVVAGAETLFFMGTLLFYFDIWDERDTPQTAPPSRRSDVGLDEQNGPILVDVFITTYDESIEVVTPSIRAAQAMDVPENTRVRVSLLDDGDRVDMSELARRFGVSYFRRDTNEGFKAGNLRNALFQTQGDFVVICDADTRFYESFLRHTLGYFRNPKVAWVQTPHWFYDLPQGESWADWLGRRFGARARSAAPGMAALTGNPHLGADPFLSDPSVFFDVIQRRRNRHGASFCCGAASVHRREAIFDGAMKRKERAVRALAAQQRKFIFRQRRAMRVPFWSRVLFWRQPDANDRQSTAQALMPCVTMQPYQFHVSEDLFTSLLLHADAEAGWISVYHPQVEARMLSPWSLEAWAAQRLKYAGGTFDIMLRNSQMFRRGLSWQKKVHYGATFWAYLSVLWAPVLVAAPVVSLLTGVAPIEAYTAAFFMHFLPVIVLGELAMLVTCKGWNVGTGRAMALATLPIQLRALFCVLRGQSPRFPPTPKTPIGQLGLRFVWPNLVMLVVMAAAGGIGIALTWQGGTGHSWTLLWVNLYWLIWNMIGVGRILRPLFWRANSTCYPDQKTVLNQEIKHEQYPHTT